MEIRNNASFLFFIHLIVLYFQPHYSIAEIWVKSGFWIAGGDIPAANIRSSLFTHLICGFADVNSTTYQISIPPQLLRNFSTFASTVKKHNPSIITLMSVWNGQPQTYQAIYGQEAPNVSVLSSMITDSSRRKSFIDSSIRTARLYRFQGIDLFWLWPNSTDMSRLGVLLDEWKAAILSESRRSSLQPLILTMGVRYSPSLELVTYPVEAIRKNVDWAHIIAYDYLVPTRENFTGNHAALYNPSSNISTDFGIKEWLSRGFPASKLVLGLPYHGYAWKLVNPGDNSTGSPSTGGDMSPDGAIGYRLIKLFVQINWYSARPVYNSTFVVNYFLSSSTWINYDDVDTIKAKIAYVKGKGMIGYNVFQVGNDDNWALTLAAQDEIDTVNKEMILLKVLLPAVFSIILFIAFGLYYIRSRSLKIETKVTTLQIGEKHDSNTSSLRIFSFDSIKEATNNFSRENKLGEGGFGPVYKGKLKGQEIAVKTLSASSTQGIEEFKNEVSLTATLQHVNLVRLQGICTERNEKMLIYEYLPNRSLDLYLFDPARRHYLDWSTQVQIIEGITQGLLYLQEYSNVTIIHRDLKASNILLDCSMNPKISDFGMAKLFQKDEREANTSRIVGTYGYAPPEYVKRGIYSMKYDVYSFGVLLLQMISGKRNASYYGPLENLTLSGYAYDLWKNERGMEFIDRLLDDSTSDCKATRCLQVALLCVQEDPGDRPTMLEVSTMLKNDTMLIAVPKMPAFSAKKQEKMGNPYSYHQELYSFDNEQISLVEPR